MESWFPLVMISSIRDRERRRRLTDTAMPAAIGAGLNAPVATRVAFSTVMADQQVRESVSRENRTAQAASLAAVEAVRTVAAKPAGPQGQAPQLADADLVNVPVLAKAIQANPAIRDQINSAASVIFQAAQAPVTRTTKVANALPARTQSNGSMDSQADAASTVDAQAQAVLGAVGASVQQELGAVGATVQQELGQLVASMQSAFNQAMQDVSKAVSDKLGDALTTLANEAVQQMQVAQAQAQAQAQQQTVQTTTTEKPSSSGRTR